MCSRWKAPALSPSPSALPTHASGDGVRSGVGPFHFRHRRADARAAGYKKARGRERPRRAKAAAGRRGRWRAPTWQIPLHTLCSHLADEIIPFYKTNNCNRLRLSDDEHKFLSVSSNPPLLSHSKRGHSAASEQADDGDGLSNQANKICPTSSVRPSDEVLEIPSRAASR